MNSSCLDKAYFVSNLYFYAGLGISLPWLGYLLWILFFGDPFSGTDFGF